ncbi:MAG: ThiF family adenylyltransferase [Gemmataceae bacterium]
MAHILQVGVGSGGMPVLDMVSREEHVTEVTIIEPDVYEEHNVHRHMFARSHVGRRKVELAQEWLQARRPELHVHILPCDVCDPASQSNVEAAVQAADLGICAVDNEPAKYHWDALMRRFGKPWTLGEVLSGGIGGFVHWFIPGGACYGCVASRLQRVEVDKTGSPDYSQPGGAVHETRIPAPKAAIEAVASLHALVTLELLANPDGFDLGFTTLLWSLQQVPDVFEEPFRPHRFQIRRSEKCLVCGTDSDYSEKSPEELDVALDKALARLGDE